MHHFYRQKTGIIHWFENKNPTNTSQTDIKSHFVPLNARLYKEPCRKSLTANSPSYRSNVQTATATARPWSRDILWFAIRGFPWKTWCERSLVSKFCPLGIAVIADQIIPKWCIVSSWVILEAIRWDIQPEKPTILVEGVNNTGESLKLVWTYVTEASEFIERVTFQRRRDNADPAEDIALNSRGGPFFVFSKFISNYSASLPATLTLRNPVTNDDEFIYSIVVSLSKNDRPAPSLTDKVQLIVRFSDIFNIFRLRRLSKHLSLYWVWERFMNQIYFTSSWNSCEKSLNGGLCIFDSPFFKSVVAVSFASVTSSMEREFVLACPVLIWN